VPERVPVRAGRDEVRFLFLGRLSEAKGAFDLVRAFARLEPGVRQRARLALAGDGARAQLAGLVQDLRVGERVEVRGWVEPSERDALLEWADVYVLPSHREGVPMAMLEAMAAGLAVIGTPVGGVPEILDPGENGLSVEPGDLAALASAMTRLALEPGTRQRLGRAGRSTAVRHDAAHYAARLLETYRAVLGKEAPERPRGAASESRGGAR
jgi:glycosyltransferase involved in cell wall biosynthesis